MEHEYCPIQARASMSDSKRKGCAGLNEHEGHMASDFTRVFGEYKPLLFSIAYRKLGTVMDAEDMVQETFLRWQNSNQTQVESPKAWLATVVTRLCINHLKSARVQREAYVGPWLPELVPKTCILADGSESFVWTVQNGILRKKAILRGREFESGTEIKEGLNDGEIVVAAPTLKLRAGQNVTVAGTLAH